LVDGAELLSKILEHAPKVKIIATSRQRLSLKSEWTFLLEGLPFPKEHEDISLDVTDALMLFAERARQVTAEFKLTKDNYQPSASICQLVEGMPLGIELAAAWTSMLSPYEIIREMEKNLDFLNNNIRDIPEKHRRPRAVFESSLKLLKEEQRESFYKLSIFRGGFDRQAALQVAGVSLQQLSILVDKSLIKRNTNGYFTFHSLLQQYAFEKLSQLKEVHAKVIENFCHYYLNMLTEVLECSRRGTRSGRSW
jgi:predicted ATPase